MTKPYILSLGGSLIVPDEIDVHYLREFQTCINVHIRSGRRFVIVTGGGKTARRYQQASAAFHDNPVHGDLLGIQATHLNANLLLSLFKNAKKISDPTKPIPSRNIIFAGGYKPGYSTDTVSAMLAKKTKATLIINLTNTDYVYDRDPKLPDARQLPDLTWEAYRKLIPKKWSPGLHAPFDPVASEICEKEKISVALINGRRLLELDNIILGKKFKGTMIHPG